MEELLAASALCAASGDHDVSFVWPSGAFRLGVAIFGDSNKMEGWLAAILVDVIVGFVAAHDETATV